VSLDEDDYVVSITPDGETRITNKTVVLKETSVTSLSKVMTAELTEQDDRTCVSEVFDQDKSFLFPYHMHLYELFAIKGDIWFCRVGRYYSLEQLQRITVEKRRIES